MRKIDELAKEKFHGNTFDAVKYLVREKDNETLDLIIDELDYAERRVGQIATLELMIEEGTLTRSEVREAKRTIKALKNETKIPRRIPMTNRKDNPYIAGVVKDLLKIIIIDGAILFLINNINDKEIVDMLYVVISVVTGYLAMGASVNLYNCIRHAIAQMNYKIHGKKKKRK